MPIIFFFQTLERDPASLYRIPQKAKFKLHSLPESILPAMTHISNTAEKTQKKRESPKTIVQEITTGG